MLVKNIIIVNYELVCFRYCHSVSGYLDEVFVWLTADCSCCCSSNCSFSLCCRWSCSCSWCCRWSCRCSCRCSCSALNMNYAALRKLGVNLAKACAWATIVAAQNCFTTNQTRYQVSWCYARPRSLMKLKIILYLKHFNKKSLGVKSLTLHL